MKKHTPSTRMKTPLLTLGLLLAAAGLIGCGDQSNQAANSFNNADLAYVRQKEYQQMYANNTSAQTVTAVATTVVNIVNTVNSTSTSITRQ
jgi:hypothetical protein